jgi:hypothetical protein
MFEIDVISEPSASFLNSDGMVRNADIASVTRYDEGLLKPALLIADQVRLVTLREDLARFVVSDAFINSQMPMRYIRIFAQMSLTRVKNNYEQIGLRDSDLASQDDARALLDGKMEGLETFGKKYNDQILKYREAYARLLRQRRDDLKSTGMTKAQQQGILHVVPWCEEEMTPYELAWVDYMDEYLPTAMEGLVRRLTSRSGIPALLEPGAEQALASLGGVEERVPQAEHKFGASTVIATALAARLPGLDRMQVEEVLDLRDDLADYLVPFRAHVMHLADDIAGADGVTPREMAQEIDYRWHRDINPALQELTATMGRGSYRRNLLNAFSEDKTTMLTTGSSLVLAAGTVFAGVGALVPAVAAAAFPFVRALNETLKTRDEARKNRLYFLFKAQRDVNRASKGRGA